MPFPIIGKYLAWRVVNERMTRVGADAMMGCRNNIFLPEELIQHLRNLGISTLNQVMDEGTYYHLSLEPRVEDI